MSNLFDSLSDYNKTIQKTPYQITGLLGLTIGGKKAVNIDTRNGYVYVRLRSNQNEVVQAYNDKVAPVYDLPVILQRLGHKWIIVGRDINRYENWGSPAPYLPFHGQTHSFDKLGGGSDVTFIYPDQFMPLLVYPSGSNGAGDLMIAPTIWRNTDGTFIEVGGTGTISILQYQPTDNSAIMGAVYLDRRNASYGILINSGTPMSALLTGSADIAPYVPSMPQSYQEPLYAFRLLSGTQSVTWDNLYSLRQFLGGSGGTGTGGGGTTGTSSSLDTYWIITPPVLTTSQDDWTPTGYDATTRLIKASSNSNYDISGLTGGYKLRKVFILNVGNHNLTFTDLDGGSSSSNQFNLGADYILTPGNWVCFEHDEGAYDYWFFSTDGTSVSDFKLDRPVLTDVNGRMSDVDWFAIRTDGLNRELILGNQDEIEELLGTLGAGGVATHILDTEGSTGGESFLWAAGTGTYGILPSEEYAGRRWSVRMRGRFQDPQGVLDGDTIGEYIGVAIGDNGNAGSPGHTGEQWEQNNHIKLVMKAVGDHTDTSRGTKWEFWTTPLNEVDKVKVLEVTDGGHLNIYSPASYDVDGIPSLVKNVVAPTVSDDNTLGYGVGTLWADTVGKNVYVCVDDSTGAAIWHTL